MDCSIALCSSSSATLSDLAVETTGIRGVGRGGGGKRVGGMG